MEDVRELGAELQRLAGTDPLDPVDSLALLERGRRHKRHRRMFSAGAALVGTASVAVGASFLPSLGAAQEQPGVAGAGTPGIAEATGDFSPVPGIARGDDGLDQMLSFEETTRRCGLRYPQVKRPLMWPGPFASGTTVQYKLQTGDTLVGCTIPGGDKPSAGLVEAARRDPMPTTTAAQLRNCSVMFWVDVTKWRVVASDTVPGVVTRLVAVSPSGRKAVACYLDPRLGATAPLRQPEPRFLTVATLFREKLDHVFGNPWNGRYGIESGSPICPQMECTGQPGYSYQGYGRVASNIARIRIAPLGSNKFHDVKVHDGWFAAAWMNSDPNSRREAKLTAYDKNGKVLQTTISTGP